MDAAITAVMRCARPRCFADFTDRQSFSRKKLGASMFGISIDLVIVGIFACGFIGFVIWVNKK
jgi:hypothetical protein